MVLLYITCKDKNEAKKISLHLLENRLIACSNMFPIESMYWWQNKLVEDKEVAIVVKTISKKVKEVEGEVKKLHSYETPCIIRIKSWANKEFSEWVKKEVNN